VDTELHPSIATTNIAQKVTAAISSEWRMLPSVALIVVDDYRCHDQRCT
jgi:hypothetical protein